MSRINERNIGASCIGLFLIAKILFCVIAVIVFLLPEDIFGQDFSQKCQRSGAEPIVNQCLPAGSFCVVSEMPGNFDCGSCFQVSAVEWQQVDAVEPTPLNDSPSQSAMEVPSTMVDVFSRAQRSAEKRAEFMARNDFRWHPPQNVGTRLRIGSSFEGVGFDPRPNLPKDQIATCRPSGNPGPHDDESAKIIGDSVAYGPAGSYRVRIWDTGKSNVQESRPVSLMRGGTCRPPERSPRRIFRFRSRR
jgi:hypothetical protein